MVAESDGIAYGSFGEGDETFLRRAGTVAQRRHTRKATQLAAAIASSIPLPDTPPSSELTASDFDSPAPATSSNSSSPDMGQSPASSLAADDRSFHRSSLTDQSRAQSPFDMDNFNVPDMPQPHIPLRKTSVSNLRQMVASRSYENSITDAESPRQSSFPDRAPSRTNSPRSRRDRQAPTSAYPGTTSPKASTYAPAVQPRGRQRGMTTSAHRPPMDSGAQFRSPSIPDLRGTARAHMASTYKPERGPTSRDPSLAFRNPPPVPWKDSDEVRASVRSALTNASYATNTSSGYYEASETDRTSVATRSSSLSNYSRQRTSLADDDDFDACDYIDLYAMGFDEDEKPQTQPQIHDADARRNSIMEALRSSIVDPAIQTPLPGHIKPTRPSSFQSAHSPNLGWNERPSANQRADSRNLEGETLTGSFQMPDFEGETLTGSLNFTFDFEQRTAEPTKYDSKFDEDISLPKSSPSSQSTPNSPALLSHPVNPAAPPSPVSSFPASPLKPDDPYSRQPISPMSNMDVSPLDTSGFQPSPIEGEATGFFPPMKPTRSNPPHEQPAPQVTRKTAEPDHVPRDRYGFKKTSQYVTVQQYDVWNATYTPYLERRKTKWEIMMIQCGLPIQDPLRFPPKSDKVKRYIRKGIPPEWRGACWFWYAGGPARLAENPGLYDRLVREADEPGKLQEIDREIIERDLNRTFPDNIDFKPDSSTGAEDEEELPIIQALRRVLQAFAIDNPSIGYCQSLNFLAGMLLLFLKNEEKAFHLLNIICNVHLPGTHAKVLEANVDVGVLMTCIRDSMPQIWSKIDDVNEGGRAPIHPTRLPTVSLATTAWFMSCFVSNLPTESVLRVWDCFFYEGSKTLFRIALAIFKAGEAEIRTVGQDLEILQVVQAIPRRLLDANALMESCYKRRNGFGHLSQDVIDTRRRERRAALQTERDRKNGQINPRLLDEMQRPPSRGRRGTLSRAASRARGLSRAKSRKRDNAQAEPMPPTPSSMLGSQI